jgi:hypothetical protein
LANGSSSEIAPATSARTGTRQFFLPAALLMERVLFGYDMRTLRPVEVMKRIPPRPMLLIYGRLKRDPASGRYRELKAAVPAMSGKVPPSQALMSSRARSSLHGDFATAIRGSCRVVM